MAGAARWTSSPRSRMLRNLGRGSPLPPLRDSQASRQSLSQWSKDIKETRGHAPNYPFIGDRHLKVSKLYGMLPAGAGDQSDGRTPADNQTVRNVFVIGPDKRIKLLLVYPMTTGRSFDEFLRVIDSLHWTGLPKVVTPVNWKRGDDVIIARRNGFTAALFSDKSLLATHRISGPLA